MFINILAQTNVIRDKTERNEDRIVPLGWSGGI